jgi:hypothetical protein
MKEYLHWLLINAPSGDFAQAQVWATALHCCRDLPMGIPAHKVKLCCHTRKWNPTHLPPHLPGCIGTR